MPVLPAVLLCPPETVSGPGTVRRLPVLAAAAGSRGLLVHGASLHRAGVIASVLAGAPAGLDLHTWQHPGGEPTVEQVDRLREDIAATGAQWVAAVGGGSVLDVAKAAAGLAGAPRPTLAYHDGEPLPAAGLPFFAAPSTAGTGSEATTVSVLTNARTGVKKSIRRPDHLARAVVLDPDLLATCPPAVIAASGMDAFTQAVEAAISRHATGLSTLLATEAARLVSAALPRVHDDPGHEAAADLLAGSFLAGLALSTARLGLVHGLAHPLGARYGVGHGLACAACLPAVLRFNRPAAGAALDRVGAVIGGAPEEMAVRLLERLALPNPFAGQALADRAGIVAETLASGSTAANPRPVTAEAVERLLDALFA